MADKLDLQEMSDDCLARVWVETNQMFQSGEAGRQLYKVPLTAVVTEILIRWLYEQGIDTRDPNSRTKD